MYLRLRAEHICIRYFVLRICVYCHLYCDMILLEGSSCLAKILGGSFQGKTSRLTISSSLLCWRVNDVYFIPEYVYSWQSSREMQAQHIRCRESTEDKR